MTSGLNINKFRFLLHGYPDPRFVNFLTFGWPINCDGVPNTGPRVSNHKGATSFARDINCYLAKELANKAIVGPFKQNPFSSSLVVSPLNSVEKADGVSRRVILDLSFPGPGSVNSCIDMSDYQGEEIQLQYPGVDSLVAFINQLGPGCLLFKRDLSRAYRQIPIDGGDVAKLGYEWEGHLFADRVLPMGLKSAAYICQQVTNSVTHILSKQGFHIVNYLDDFAGAEQPGGASRAFEALGHLLQELGLQEASDKACPPATVMTFLGIGFDTDNMSLFITQDRLTQIKQELHEWLNKHKASKREVQSIIGKLNFLSKCVRPGRVFMNRLLNFLREFKNNRARTIPGDFKRDIQWWAKFVQSFNGVRIMPPSAWSSPGEHLVSDACLVGGGAASPPQYFKISFPSYMRDWHINQLELFTILLACKLWAPKLAGKRILVQCDNSVAVWAINKLGSSSVLIQKMIRELLYWAAYYQFEIKAVHIPGAENRVADWLSRWHEPAARNSFQEWNAKSGWEEVEVPGHLWDWTSEWC